jgi:hypothetical protein
MPGKEKLCSANNSDRPTINATAVIKQVLFLNMEEMRCKDGWLNTLVWREIMLHTFSNKPGNISKQNVTDW